MICITFYDGSFRYYPKGITPIEIALDFNEKIAKEVLAASLNGQQVELSTPIIKINIHIIFYTWKDTIGKKTFWNSSAHLLAKAILKIYPQAKLTIGKNIENGFYYDVDLVRKSQSVLDFSILEKYIIEYARKNYNFESYFIYKKKSFEYYNDNHYKINLIKELQNDYITFCNHDNFLDICRKMHIFSTGKIKYIKILNISGAYWSNDEKNQQLTRIYGISFPKKKQMNEFLLSFYEAKERDHRKLGKELELFNFSDSVGVGLPLWYPRGTILRQYLEDFLIRTQKKYGYEMVVTPHIGNKKLYKKSGHFDKYENDIYLTKFNSNENDIMLKSMNCPHHCEIYRSRSWSYKDLPKRFAEFGNVYRYEQSGELHGLTRTRGFTQDDAHIFCTKDQLLDEFHKVIDLILYILQSIGFKDYTVQISLRDMNNMNKYIGKEQNWKKAEETILEAVLNKNLPIKKKYGEAAFYGPKLDFMVKDSLKRNWQLGTIQIDYNLPERFDLQYKGPDNLLHRPVLIHRAPFGSLERFIALLIENTSGNFPFWLSPIQVIVIPISEKYIFYAEKILHLLYKYGISSDIDLRSKKIGKKIRYAEFNKIPFMAIIGEKEMYNYTITLRAHNGRNIGTYTIQDFLDFFLKEMKLNEKI